MTAFQRIALAVCAVVSMILVGVFSYKIGDTHGYKKGYAQALDDVQKDTITIVDTVFYDKPIPEYHYIDKPIYIPVHDTTLLVKNDTTYVVLEREIKGYSSEDYKCQVSGVQPALDWIEVYPKTTTIVKTIDVPVKRHWSFGITAGPAIVYNGSIHGGFGIAGGIQYNF